MITKRCCFWLTAFLLVQLVWGQNFPQRSIELLHPWAPGSAMAVSQILAEALGKELGVAVVTVSRPGATGTKAFIDAMNRPADGYTIIDGYVAPLVLQPLLGNVDWTYSDFEPLWSATANAFALVSHPKEKRWKDFPGLLAYMRAHPGKLRYAAANTGSLPHMVMAKVLQESNVIAQQVPYPELSLSIKDFRSKILDFSVVNPSTYVTNKKYVRVDAVFSELKSVQDIYDGAPRIADFGVDIGVSGLSPMGWNWWLVKKGTPPDVLKTLRDAMGRALKNPDLQQRVAKTGFVLLNYSPEQYAEKVEPVMKQLKSAADAIEWEKKELAKYR